MRRIVLPFALLLAISLVFVGCGSKSKSKSSNASSSSGGSSTVAGAEMAPAGVQAFISINSDSSGDQWKQAQALLARIPAAQKSLATALTKSGVVLADVEQALGNVTDIVVLGDAKKPTLVMLTEPKDAAKLKALLAKAPGKTKPATADIGSWLAVADSQAMLDQFQSAGSAKLADLASFKEAMSALPSDALVRAYVPGATVTGALTSLASSVKPTKSKTSSGFSLSVSPKSLVKSVQKNPLDWAGFSASAVSGGISVEGVFKGKNAPTAAASSLMSELPSGTAFAADLNGAALGLDKSVMKLANNAKYASSVRQIETMLGIKLKDVAALVGSEMAVYGTASGVGVLIKAPDPAKASLIVNKVVTLLSSFTGGKGKKVSVAGVTATELTIGKTAHVYLGVMNGDLFVTTDVASLPGASKLSSDPVYSAATKDLPIPSANDGALFIDFKQLETLGKSGNSLLKGLTKSLSSSLSTKPPSGKSKVTTGPKPADVKAAMQSISSLLGYVTTNGDKVELKALLSVK